MTEFWQMGGYAFFVWTAYGISIALIVLNAIWPLWQRRAVIKQIRRYWQRQQQLQARSDS